MSRREEVLSSVKLLSSFQGLRTPCVQSVLTGLPVVVCSLKGKQSAGGHASFYQGYVISFLFAISVWQP